MGLLPSASCRSPSACTSCGRMVPGMCWASGTYWSGLPCLGEGELTAMPPTRQCHHCCPAWPQNNGSCSPGSSQGANCFNLQALALVRGFFQDRSFC